MIAYLDCSTGVSGDKFLGALLDAGEAGGAFTAEHLGDIVAALAPEARVSVERVNSHGIAAVGVRVEAERQPAHRHWPDIRALLESSPLPGPVRRDALAVFEALAEAEATAHGTSVDAVHFHEVGALDSIADVVGVCSGIHALGIESLAASPIATGSGSVETSHGVLPVPAPATATLLIGIPTVPGPSTSELTTPTGAALVRVLARSFGPMPAMRSTGQGYGAGSRDIGAANVCRLTIGTVEPSSERVALLETNIDHLPAEELAFAAEELLAAGALDVWQTPIVMKKGRSAVMLSVLAHEAEADTLAERIIALTGTLGVRRESLARTVADRESIVVETEWGPARVKLGAGRVRPEHDDVARIAREHALPYRAVAAEIARVAESQATARG
ncbi:MAG: nickel pincer cofactor biosynthesis protein LarC [Coriobacteriia bacterium]|nr:nickel pincer cofactor biosynthesis protein LarC [Coriobacteriia bacterium]